jgi:hypothetical protein
VEHDIDTPRREAADDGDSLRAHPTTKAYVRMLDHLVTCDACGEVACADGQALRTAYRESRDQGRTQTAMGDLVPARQCR